MRFGIVDETVEEPLGGAHRDPELVGERLRASLLRFFKQVDAVPTEQLLQQRYDRFRKVGAFASQQAAPTPPAA